MAVGGDDGGRWGRPPSRDESAAIVVDQQLGVRGRTPSASRLLRASRVFSVSLGRLAASHSRDAATLSRAVAIAESEGGARCAFGDGALDVEVVRLDTASGASEFVILFRAPGAPAGRVAARRPDVAGTHPPRIVDKTGHRRRSNLALEVLKVLAAEDLRPLPAR